MSLRKPFQVKSTIGKSYDVDPKDVLRTKAALHATGHYELPEWGISDTLDQAALNALTDFQEQHGLKQDGTMHPGGVTEQKINQELAQKKAKPVQVATTGSMTALLAPAVGGNTSANEELNQKVYNQLQDISRDVRLGFDKTMEDLPDRIERFALRNTWSYPKISGKEILKMHDGTEAIVADRIKLPRRPGEYQANLPDGSIAIFTKGQDIHGNEIWEEVDRYWPAPITKRTEIAPQVEPSPGLIPPEVPHGQREEFPAHNDNYAPPPSHPAPVDPRDYVSPFPIADPLFDTTFLESRGNAETQARNNKGIEIFLQEAKKLGLKLIHVSGGHTPAEYLNDGEASYKKERLIQGRNGLRGMRPDMGFIVELASGHKVRIDANTVTTLADGVTLTKQEADALDRFQKLLVLNGETGTIIDLAKHPGRNLDEWAEEYARPIIREGLETLKLLIKEKYGIM